MIDRILYRAQMVMLASLLAACQSGPTVKPVQSAGDIAVMRLADGESPPQVAGECWASDTAPAVIETITQQVQTKPERRDATGQITQAAEFQTRTSQRMVSDRATVWFRAPCTDTVTLAFVASLQRALKARGWFSAPVSGQMDPDTLAAVRKYQRSRGLDSAQLSLTTAQDLGLIPAIGTP